MKKIREKFTIVERLIFLLILILIIMIAIPIISDIIEQPKRDKAKQNAKNYIEIVNTYIKDLKNQDEELFNKIVKYNSFSKYCSITDKEKQILTCGDEEISIPSNEILPELDSVIYFSSEGAVAGYKIITNGYRVTYPNSKNMTTIKRYKPKSIDEEKIK